MFKQQEDSKHNFNKNLLKQILYRLQIMITLDYDLRQKDCDRIVTVCWFLVFVSPPLLF